MIKHEFFIKNFLIVKKHSFFSFFIDVEKSCWIDEEE